MTVEPTSKNAADKDNKADLQVTDVNLQKVMLEIEEEVRTKRASGELPADVEKELDQVFARFAPAGALDSDFESLVARAERQSYIDLLAPNESSRPVVPQVKRVVQKTVRWYLRYVVDQFALFAGSISRAVRMLGERVESLEAATMPDELQPIVMAELRKRAIAWTPQITSHFANVLGRVLVTSCGTGEFVKALNNERIDAYGIDEAADLVAAGSTNDLDLRSNNELDHLEVLGAGSLAGAVFSGYIDIAKPREQVEMITLAAIALQPGAPLAMIVTNASRWDDLQDVPTDLAAGKPLRPSTWTMLLEDRGFKDVAVTPNTPGDGFLIYATR